MSELKQETTNKEETVTDVIAPLTKEEEETLLEALSSKHQFTEKSDPSE
jgi:hypothetical protein